jgi:hypothetical protein
MFLSCVRNIMAPTKGHEFSKMRSHCRNSIHTPEILGQELLELKVFNSSLHYRERDKMT